VFNFSFGDNGTVAMDMQQHHGNTSKNVGNFAAQPKVRPPACIRFTEAVTLPQSANKQ
jgi:hypothetical protein